MYKDKVVRKTAEYIRERQAKDSSGHDWWHSYRVWNMGKGIAREENANIYVVELGCLLHDVADFKLHDGDEKVGPELAEEWLYGLHVNPKIVSHVKEIVASISFKGANSKNKAKSLEAQCVQDADRLDAIGAIGLARCFAFGGKKGNIIYDPAVAVNLGQSEEEYKKSNHPQINHFYEKLLLIKSRLNTDTAKKLAEERHAFMELFLEQFFKEWAQATNCLA